MIPNRLKILPNAGISTGPNKLESSQKSRRQEFQARFDRLWLLNGRQFDPDRNAMERERLNRTLKLILQHLPLEKKLVADLGCGSGILSKRLAAQKALVDAVDISGNALKRLQQEETTNITPIQDFVPTTLLKDDHYDLVVSTELIAYLPQELYRLFFSELARVVKPSAHMVCSTSVDINSDDALKRFISLAETEFELKEAVFSYHRFTLKLLNIFKAPARFIRAAKDPEYRQDQIRRRSGISQWWFSINSTPFGKIPSYLFKYLFYLPAYFLSQNRGLLLCLEKICQFLCRDRGISHVILMGTKKTFSQPALPQEMPIEVKHKKQVWE